MHKKGELGPVIKVLFEIFVGLGFLVALISFLPGTLKAGTDTLFATLGFGQSADAFEKQTLDLSARAANAAGGQGQAATSEQLTIYKQMIANWEQFSQTRNAKQTTDKTREEITKAYQAVIDSSFGSFSLPANACAGKASDATAFAQSPCADYFTYYASASNTGVALKPIATQQDFDLINKALENIDRSFGTFTVYTLKEKPQEESDKIKPFVCTNIESAIRVCKTLSGNVDDHVYTEESACIHITSMQAQYETDLKTLACTSS